MHHLHGAMQYTGRPLERFLSDLYKIRHGVFQVRKLTPKLMVVANMSAIPP